MSRQVERGRLIIGANGAMLAGETTGGRNAAVCVAADRHRYAVRAGDGVVLGGEADMDIIVPAAADLHGTATALLDAGVDEACVFQ